MKPEENHTEASAALTPTVKKMYRVKVTHELYPKVQLQSEQFYYRPYESEVIDVTNDFMKLYPTLGSWDKLKVEILEFDI